MSESNESKKYSHWTSVESPQRCVPRGPSAKLYNQSEDVKFIIANQNLGKKSEARTNC